VPAAATSPAVAPAGGALEPGEYLRATGSALVIVEAAPEPLLQVRSPDRWPSCRPPITWQPSRGDGAAGGPAATASGLGARRAAAQRGWSSRGSRTVSARISGAYASATSHSHSPSHSTEPGARRLQLLQLVSPALPVGAFSYSEGLEVLVQAQTDHQRWRSAQLVEGRARPGAIAIEAAAPGAPVGRGLALRRCATGSVSKIGCQRERQAELIDLDGWLLALARKRRSCGPAAPDGTSLLQLVAELGWPLPSSPAPRLAWPALGLGWPGA